MHDPLSLLFVTHAGPPKDLTTEADPEQRVPGWHCSGRNEAVPNVLLAW